VMAVAPQRIEAPEAVGSYRSCLDCTSPMERWGGEAARYPVRDLPEAMSRRRFRSGILLLYPGEAEGSHTAGWAIYRTWWRCAFCGWESEHEAIEHSRGAEVK
jgi:hypothetical protein